MRGSVKKDGASWTFVADVPRGPDGKRKQVRRRGFSTRREAEAALQQLLQQARTNSYVPPSPLTVGEYLREQWLPSVKHTVRRSTEVSYRGHVEGHIVPALGQVPLQSLTRAAVSALYTGLLARGLSAKTVRNVHATLRTALNSAVGLGHVATNVAEQAVVPQAVRPVMRTWSTAECQRFLAGVADDDLAIAYELLAVTGMRRGEVLGLRWSASDLDELRVEVNQALVTVEYQLDFVPPKTKQGWRRIPIPPATAARLRRHRARQSEQRLLLGEGWTDLDLVVARPDGQPVHPDLMSDAFDRHVARSGLPRIRLHDLRHTWATLSLQAGVPPHVVSKTLGHSSVAFTLDVYAHATPVSEDQARTVGNLIVGEGA